MVTETERNAIIAECAELIDKEASEWNTAFFDFLDGNMEDGADYALTKAMTLQDAADMLRMLNPVYKAKKEEESKKAKEWLDRIKKEKA